MPIVRVGQREEVMEILGVSTFRSSQFRRLSRSDLDKSYHTFDHAVGSVLHP